MLILQSLTVEPRFKSSGDVAELLTIGEIAQRAHVATPTVRYYERRDLLAPDGRQSGQRRYRTETPRRLVFIGSLQDAGLPWTRSTRSFEQPRSPTGRPLPDNASPLSTKSSAQLKYSRDLLAAALGCRFDHPATDCRKIGAEIDRRLSTGHQEWLADVASGTQN
jgi:MerR family redox-sensitive transcriptional activator SoxR